MDNITKLKDDYKNFLDGYSYSKITSDENFNFNEVNDKTDLAVIYYTIAYQYLLLSSLFNNFTYIGDKKKLTDLKNIDLLRDPLSKNALDMIKNSKKIINLNIPEEEFKSMLGHSQSACSIIDDKIKTFNSSIKNKLIYIVEKFRKDFQSTPPIPPKPSHLSPPIPPKPSHLPPPIPLKPPRLSPPIPSKSTPSSSSSSSSSLSLKPPPPSTPKPQSSTTTTKMTGGYKKKPKKKVLKKKVSKKKVSKKKPEKKKVSKKKVSKKKPEKKKISKKKVSKTPMKSTVTRDGKKYVVRTGDRGGKYIMKNKVKVYL
jgi:hypothetical protein